MVAEADSGGRDGRAPLDAAGRLAEDRRCCRCGYNLRGLEPEQLCPECAQPVHDSLVANDLRYANRQWLSQVRSGLALLVLAVGGICASVLLFLAATIVGALARMRGGSAGDIMWIVALTCSIVSVVPAFLGMLLLTVQEPAERLGRPVWARLAARCLFWTAAVLGGTTILLILLAFAGVGILVALILAGVVAGLATAIAACRYMQSLIGRGGAAGGDIAVLAMAGLLGLGVTLVCWCVASFVLAAPGVADAILVTGAVVHLGIGPATLAVSFLLVLRTYRVVNQAWSDNPDRYGQTPGSR
ncbi:MAG: hypothetical protein PVJ57_05135 [Phycisphaerae bacterium]|jgi:hypothetical protein